MKPSCCTLALLAILCLASSTPLAAQSLTAGPEIQLALTGWKGVQGPTLASGPGGGFLSSWVDGGTLNLRAFSPDGAPLGLTRQLSPSSARPTSSELAALGPDRYVVVWAQGSLRGQILDAAGAPVGPQLVLADGAVDFFVSAEPTGGGFVIAWMNAEPSTPYKFQIKVRRFDAQGTPASAIFLATPAGSYPSIAALPDGGFAVAWFHGDSSNPSTVYSIRARAFHADGTPAGPETTVPEPAGDITLAVRVSADAAGRWIAAWTEFPTVQNSYRVKAWRFSPTGQPLGPPILVAEPEEEGRISYVAIPVMRPDGSFLVSWEESNALTGGPSNLPGDSVPTGADVRARAFDAAGDPLGPDFLVHPGEEGEQHLGDVAATIDGWIVAWKRRLDPQAGVYARRFTLSCGTGNELCLNGGRFRARVVWHTSPSGPEGEGRPIGLAGDTGAFWFFSPTNAELVVKVLDGTAVNDHFWVFYGSLTDVAFDLTITDTLTGQERTYHNPAGTMASRADTEAFASTGGLAARPAASLALSAATSACGDHTLCLDNGRFEVAVGWRVAASGTQGQGTAAPLTDQTGTFWFFNPANVELIVKVLDGTGVNGHFWVFYGSLTDVELDLTVTDTATGQQRTYHNPAGTLASKADTQAFPEEP
jgi:hypothetical protein